MAKKNKHPLSFVKPGFSFKKGGMVSKAQDGKTVTIQMPSGEKQNIQTDSPEYLALYKKGLTVYDPATDTYQTDSPFPLRELEIKAFPEVNPEMQNLPTSDPGTVYETQPSSWRRNAIDLIDRGINFSMRPGSGGYDNSGINASNFILGTGLYPFESALSLMNPVDDYERHGAFGVGMHLLGAMPLLPGKSSIKNLSQSIKDLPYNPIITEIPKIPKAVNQYIKYRPGSSSEDWIKHSEGKSFLNSYAAALATSVGDKLVKIPYFRPFVKRIANDFAEMSGNPTRQPGEIWNYFNPFSSKWDGHYKGIFGDSAERNFVKNFIYQDDLGFVPVNNRNLIGLQKYTDEYGPLRQYELNVTHPALKGIVGQWEKSLLNRYEDLQRNTGLVLPTDRTSGSLQSLMRLKEDIQKLIINDKPEVWGKEFQQLSTINDRVQKIIDRSESLNLTGNEKLKYIDDAVTKTYERLKNTFRKKIQENPEGILAKPFNDIPNFDGITRIQDDIGGHMQYWYVNPETNAIHKRIQDIWKFKPDEYSEKWLRQYTRWKPERPESSSVRESIIKHINDKSSLDTRSPLNIASEKLNFWFDYNQPRILDKIGKPFVTSADIPYYAKGGNTNSKHPLSFVKPGFSFKKKGGVINDPAGQWAHPGEVTRIPSNRITMKGVGYPVLGVDNTGYKQLMMPGGEYSYPGTSVTEYPMMQIGGSYVPQFAAPPKRSLYEAVSDWWNDSEESIKKEKPTPPKNSTVTKKEVAVKKKTPAPTVVYPEPSVVRQPYILPTTEEIIAQQQAQDVVEPSLGYTTTVTDLKAQAFSSQPIDVAEKIEAAKQIDFKKVLKEKQAIINGVPKTLPPSTPKVESLDDIKSSMQTAYYDVTNPDPKISAAGKIAYTKLNQRYIAKIKELNEKAESDAGWLDSWVNKSLPSMLSKPYQKFGLGDQPELYEQTTFNFETYGQKKEKERQEYLSSTTVEDLGVDPNNRWRLRASASNDNPLVVIPYGNRAEREKNPVNIQGKGTLMHFLDQSPITGYLYPGYEDIINQIKDTQYIGILDPVDEEKGEYNLKYIPKSQFKKEKRTWGKGNFYVRQVKFDNIDFNKKIKDGNFDGHTYWGMKTNELPLQISSGKNEDIYNYSSGQSVVFIYPYSGQTRYTQFSGSPSEIRKEGERLKKEYGLNKGDLTIGISDAGSYASNIKSQKGIINNELLNSRDMGYYNRTPYTGAGMVLKQYGGMNDHLSVYPMAMNNGGKTNPNFPNQENNYTNNRLSSFINMVRGSAQKALEKQMMKDAAMANMPMPMGIPMQSGGSTPYQNGLTAGSGWLARHGGSHDLPKAQYGTPFEYNIDLGRSTYIPPLNINPSNVYTTKDEIVPGSQITGMDVNRKGRSFTLDVSVPQDELNLANQIQVQPQPGQQNWSMPSFNGPTDASGNQIQMPDYSAQTPPTMDPAQNNRLAVTPPTAGEYKSDKIKFKRGPKLSGEQKMMLFNTGMETVTNFANRIDVARKEEDLRKRRMADRLFDPVQGNRGDYTANYGYFRPDQMVPVQFSGAAGSRNYGQYGGSQGNSMYLTEDEIQQILANGGEIEYLD